MIQLSANANEAKVFRAHAAPLGLCDNLVNALKLPACSNVRGVFPVHERFWFCLFQVSTTQFSSFPSFLMARVSDGTNVPISPAPASSSNMGSPNGSLPDLGGTGCRASTMEEKINEIYLQLPI